MLSTAQCSTFGALFLALVVAMVRSLPIANEAEMEKSLQLRDTDTAAAVQLSESVVEDHLSQGTSAAVDKRAAEDQHSRAKRGCGCGGGGGGWGKMKRSIAGASEVDGQGLKRQRRCGGGGMCGVQRTARSSDHKYDVKKRQKRCGGGGCGCGCCCPSCCCCQQSCCQQSCCQTCTTCTTCCQQSCCQSCCQPCCGCGGGMGGNGMGGSGMGGWGGNGGYGGWGKRSINKDTVLRAAESGALEKRQNLRVKRCGGGGGGCGCGCCCPSCCCCQQSCCQCCTTCTTCTTCCQQSCCQSCCQPCCGCCGCGGGGMGGWGKLRLARSNSHLWDLKTRQKRCGGCGGMKRRKQANKNNIVERANEALNVSDEQLLNLLGQSQ